MQSLKRFLLAPCFATTLTIAVGGCDGTGNASESPDSAEFAARCSAALQIYYVEGGKGPEFTVKSARARYWTKRFHDLSGSGDGQFSAALKKWQSIHRELSEAHKGKGIARKNEAMKQIMDRCAAYEM